MSIKTKYAVTMATVISLAGVAWTQKREGTVLKPYYDSGKVATIGTGTTVYPNGQKVKITDSPITKKQAAEYLKFHMNKDAKIFNKSLLSTPLSQDEYDLYVDFTYQFGTGAWSQSSMLKNLKARQYKQACNSLLKWKYVNKFDCSTPGNKVCSGVWKRQLERHAKCLGAN